MIVDKNVKSLEESVYQRLEEEILSGKLSRGETLTETSLTARLGASRTPVRAALHRLAEEGLVEISPNRGAVVMGVTAEDLVDIYKMRMRLEGLASREAAEKISEEDKADVKAAIEKLRETLKGGDTEAIKADTEALEKAFYALSEKLYKQSGAQGAGPDMGGAQQNGDSTYYNADYEDKTQG